MPNWLESNCHHNLCTVRRKWLRTGIIIVAVYHGEVHPRWRSAALRGAWVDKPEVGCWSAPNELWWMDADGKQGPMPCTPSDTRPRYSMQSCWHGGRQSHSRVTNDTAKVEGKTGITHSVNVTAWRGYPSCPHAVKPATLIRILHFNQFKSVKGMQNQRLSSSLWQCV